MEIIKQFMRLFGRRNPQYESLTEYNTDKLKVRIWRTEATLFDASVPDRSELLSVWRSVAERPVVIIANELGACDRVACVAIVDADGNGMSYYPDWH